MVARLLRHTRSRSVTPTTFGADANGVPSIVLVMKTGSLRSKGDILRKPAPDD